LPGVASISPSAHTSACNTAMRTQQLLDFISPSSPPEICSSYAALLENRLLLRTPQKQNPPGRFIGFAESSW
jgi:hypothetical protein